MNKKNFRKGIMLIVVSLVLVVLLILVGAFIMRGIQEGNLTQRQKERYEAFNIAEAGLDKSVVELRNNFNWSGFGPAAFGRGEYYVAVNSISASERNLDCFGYVPLYTSARQTVHIEARIRKAIPVNFYDNAIYSAEEVDLNGNAYSVAGDIRYAESIDNTGNVAGTITNDPSISPLARLDFTQLYNISTVQGNVYDSARLKNVQKGSDNFPSSFWYDEANNIPNVVYVTQDLALNGNIGTIGGFFVVAGDVLTDPSGGADASINGNGQIAGCIYTLGEFTVNGGGGGLNVDGGIWSAEETTINGNATVQYNTIYMNAISGLNINPDIQVVGWREV
ncbi:MAG: hypothetical protein Q8L26_05255 [Candidatus Omnitrophota bacterium]|nr:hypothetical protein [Candidatus Omnitrophota bacterium]